MKQDFELLFNDLCMENNQYHSYNTRSNKLFHSVQFKTNVRKFSLKVTGCSIWNNLPDDLKAINSRNWFKKELKRYLIHIDNQM